ncbi:MAG: hypothetical protein ACM3MN_08465 [Nitrospirota bacterium]
MRPIVAAGSRSNRRPPVLQVGVVYGAKRIRSIYLPSPSGRAPVLSTTTPLERPGLALHYQRRDHALA